MSNFGKQIELSALNSVTYREYLDSVKIFESFATDSQWIWSLKYDMLLNPNLAKDICDCICILKQTDDINILDKFMMKFRKKSKEYFDLANKVDNAVEKWFFYRNVHAYYGFVEVINEGSILTDKILKNLKNEYGDRYLEVLQKADQSCPSKLTDFYLPKYSDVTNSPSLEMYLFMKKWQDSQNIYFHTFIKEHHNAKIEFENYIKQKYPYLKDINDHSLLGIVLLNDLPFFNLEQVNKFLINNIVDNLTYIIGGKSLGLAKLQYNDINIPDTFVVPVGSLYNKKYLEFLKNLPNYDYSVRSSATVEDSTKNSFAGLFISKLAIKKDRLDSNINDVLQSVFSKRVDEYVKKFNTDKPYMSVILQKFIEPKCSGVWLGTTENTGHLEWVVGNGEKLVSGHIKPNYENWEKELLLDSALVVDNETVGEKCIEIQKKMNAIADFEWCEVDNKLLFVQYRPTTVKLINKQKKDQIGSLVGTAASSGVALGIPVYLDDPHAEMYFPKDGVLLTDYTDPDWVPIIIKSKAIITAEGGILSHTAIISRELGIPCITGFGDEQLEKVKKMDYIEVNGTNGVVIDKSKVKKMNK